MAVFPVVEGHGEIKAVPRLLHRVWTYLQAPQELRVLQPFRLPRGKMTKAGDPELSRALGLGRHKLASSGAERRVVLLLVDADDACLAGTFDDGLGPHIASRCQEVAADLLASVVAADQDYEAWLLAGSGDKSAEGKKGKRRIKEELGRWSETVDQPAWTSRLDVSQTRRLSRSFDKLCREVESWASAD